VGLPLSLLYLMRPALAELAKSASRVLCLGYPDVVEGRDTLSAAFGESIRSSLVVRKDSQVVRRHHGLPDGEAVETRSLFAALGLQLECIDVQDSYGVDRIVDLNEPLPPDLVGRYGMVIDPGTIEHCFNIGQAMMNTASTLAVGGFAVHVNPLTMFNHGFYNLNPTFYHDFYGANGFEILFINGLAQRLGAGAFFEVPPMARLNGVPEHATIIVIARRIAERPLVWPMQAKYRRAAPAA
jgi:hypothetical protein